MAAFPSAGKISTKLLLSFLAATSPTTTAASWADGWNNAVNQIPMVSIPAFAPSTPSESPDQASQDHVFTLRHIFHHGVYEYPDLHKRRDVRPGDTVWTAAEGEEGRVRAAPLHARSRQLPIQRLSDRSIPILQNLISTARRTGSAVELGPSAWTLDEVPGPNITDKETVVNLAIMAANAYDAEPGTGEWEDVNAGFNYSNSFGWEGDGLRGHIFADQGNKTIVVALKGTTPAVFDGSGTTTKDKINDNLFFSCCCGQGGHFLWKQVCDCSTSAFTCNQTCLIKALRRENRYYQAATELYGNVTELYPRSNIWFSGHSLGGSVSSMLGLTFGLPVTTFEAPGEALAAARLGLPAPPNSHPSAPQSRSNTGAYHFGHTADPIFMGTCNAVTSACTLGGYAMETQCHTGHVCVYDTVKDKNWRVTASWHSIRNTITSVFRAYDKVAECIEDTECVDCFNWKYYESNGSDTTTTTSSTSSSTSSTRTSICKTPGWWGCRDETTTSLIPISTTTSTLTSATVTCTAYGWFGGCLGSITTTIISTITSTITSTIAAPERATGGVTATSDRGGATTTSCQSYGWFGRCLDPTPASYGYMTMPRETARPTF
ncbi:MAG: hypothetical protein LQ350_002779 [Teloschistes chrysophthalmus]|nr:MAG: hypothetical protein LQ350_002779 [Niorma chrysophthalma]